MKVLVIDIGGTHVKVASTDNPVPVKIVSGTDFKPQQLVESVLQATEGWEYDAVTIGYPGPIVRDRPAREPHNLGSGWVDFAYETAFPRPVRFMNDAAMQALGGYKGGKMLFLGIGTGLGSALIVDQVVIPLEMAHLPYRKGRTYEEYVGLAGMERRGKRKWRKSVEDVIEKLRAAFVVDYVLLGGGNAKLMGKLPDGVQLGANANAIAGGIALWQQHQTPVPTHRNDPAPDATEPASSSAAPGESSSRNDDTTAARQATRTGKRDK